jgi:HK97 family phage prohead protease/HK97 family phage major capsid protein
MYDAWGGKSMLPWAKKKVKEMTERQQRNRAEALKNKVEEHNKDVDAAHKKATVSMLEKVYDRGVGAYKTNPSSVRPSVKTPEQWAMARVNSFLYALKNERFRGGKHDTDLFPKGHPLRSKEKEEKMEEKNSKQLAELRNKYGDDVELRTAEVRAAGDDSLVIEGYAANFEQRTDLGYFKEEIARGAFEDVMEDDVRLLLNHDGAPMARTTNGTLELSVDENGLKYRAALADTQDGRDMYKLIKRGDITQSSFAFTIGEQEFSEDRSVRRVLKVARLLDVSPVTYPAYPTTTVAARQMAMQEPEPVEETETISEAQPEKQEVRTFEQTAESKPAKQFKIMNLRNSNDAARYISQLEDKLANINALAETEERALTSEELEETQDIHAKLEAAEQQRDALAKNEQRLKARAVAADAVVRSDKEAIKANAKFDFGKAMRELSNGQALTGLEKEALEEARHEASSRGLEIRGNFAIPQSMLVQARNVYGVDSSQSGVNDAVTTVATEVTELVGALRANSLLAATGATQLNGFVGDIKMPSLPTDAASTPVEGAAVGSNTGAMGSATLSPQRIAQQMIVTKEAMNQTSGNMSNVIAADFGRAIAIAQDKIALNAIHGVGGAAALAGQTGTVVGRVETGDNDIPAITADNVRDLWSTITANGAENNTAFVAHPSDFAFLMSLANVSNVSALVENGQIMGYNVLSSGTVPSIDATAVNANEFLSNAEAEPFGANGSALRFLYYGDWTDLFYANWGGLDVTIDPFSQLSEGNVKIVVDTFFDAKVRRAESLGAMVFAQETILGANG